MTKPTAQALTSVERDVLEQLRLRPNGAPVRGDELRSAVIALAGRQLVCDPHQMGEALFTRITDAGKAELEKRS